MIGWHHVRARIHKRYSLQLFSPSFRKDRFVRKACFLLRNRAQPIQGFVEPRRDHGLLGTSPARFVSFKTSASNSRKSIVSDPASFTPTRDIKIKVNNRVVFRVCFMAPSR